MLIYVNRNYDYPDLFRQTPNNSGKWGDFQFTFDAVDECDYIVVLNHPSEDIKIKCRKGGRILLIQEPPYAINNYFKLHFRFYDTIVSGFSPVSRLNMINQQTALPWHIEKSFNELQNLTLENIIKKKNSVSWVTSNNNIFKEHEVRLKFIEYLKSQNYNFDLFGRGFNPIDDKFNGIYPYKYTIAAENYIGDNYFTEKIIDAYLSWTMPIFYGSNNITKYFPEESMIIVDLNKPEKALEKIKSAIEGDLWSKNIDAIRYSRELILNKYQLFPMLSNLIRNIPSSSSNSIKYKNVFLPHSGLTRAETLKKKLKEALQRK